MGQTRKGVVKNIADFGAFIDLGGLMRGDARRVASDRSRTSRVVRRITDSPPERWKGTRAVWIQALQRSAMLIARLC